MKQFLGKVAVLFFVSLLPLAVYAESKVQVRTISAEAFLQTLKKNPKANLLDVRSAEEFSEVKLPRAVNVPLPTLDTPEGLQKALQPFAPKEDVYILCRSGRRSTIAAEKFVAAGHNNVVVVEGGMNRLESLGATVEKKAAN